jgi:membrane-associated protease RseP (regulator of RpoE activity)
VLRDIGWPAAIYAGLMAIIAVHEASHAVAARAGGLPCRRVIVGVGPRWCVLRVTVAGVPVEFRLFPFGGLADIPITPDAPLRARLVATAAGPAGNLWFGIAMLVAAAGPQRALLAAMQALDMLPGLLARMAEAAFAGGPLPLAEMPAALPVRLDWALDAALVRVMSLLVGAFNLLPLPPLDGGWLLYWPLERRYPALRDRRARRAAAAIGGAALAALNLPLLRQAPWSWVMPGAGLVIAADWVARYLRRAGWARGRKGQPAGASDGQHGRADASISARDRLSPGGRADGVRDGDADA